MKYIILFFLNLQLFFISNIYLLEYFFNILIYTIEILCFVIIELNKIF